jgi:hypothetical protein
MNVARMLALQASTSADAGHRRHQIPATLLQSSRSVVGTDARSRSDMAADIRPDPVPGREDHGVPGMVERVLGR